MIFIIKFKDNRIRFSANYKYLQDYNGIEYPLVKKSNLWVKTAMYNDEGKVRSTSAKQKLETFINDYIADITESIKNNKSNDNW